MKLCVFAGTTLADLYAKGEIKARYYNPENVFGEVHFITFTDHEIEPEKVRQIAGNAKIVIHAMGPLQLKRLAGLRKKVLEEVRAIGPDAIRAYSATIHGYLAAYCARQLHVPCIVSLHNHFDDMRRLFWKTGQYKNAILYEGFKRTFEPYVMKNADCVICAYAFPAKYASQYAVKRLEIVYNRVYRDAFEKAEPALAKEKPTVICVGRLIAEKNQECLIRALPLVDPALGVHLLLIGEGPDYGRLQALARESGVESSVRFIRSVPNEKIASYYKSADVFALPIRWGGVAIPVIEAMAAGLPVIVGKPQGDPEPEISSEIGLVVENTPEAFADAITRVLSDKNLYASLRQKGKQKFDAMEGTIMEKKEADIYRSMASKNLETQVRIVAVDAADSKKMDDFAGLAKDAGFDAKRIADFQGEIRTDQAFATLAYHGEKPVAFYVSRRIDKIPPEKRDERSQKRMDAARRTFPELAGKSDVQMAKLMADSGNAFVQEDQRGHGVGTRLYAGHEAQAQALGYRYKMEAARSPDEKGDAQRILVKLGYVNTGPLGYMGMRYQKPLYGFIKKLE